MLAYLDTYSGLIPCTVLRVVPQTDRKRTSIAIRLNATRGAYKRGETLLGSPSDVFPRSHVVGRFRRYCGATLIGGYDWRAHIDWLAHVRATRRYHPLPRAFRDSVDWLRGAICA